MTLFIAFRSGSHFFGGIRRRLCSASCNAVWLSISVRLSASLPQGLLVVRLEHNSICLGRMVEAYEAQTCIIYALTFLAKDLHIYR